MKGVYMRTQAHRDAISRAAKMRASTPAGRAHMGYITQRAAEAPRTPEYLEKLRAASHRYSLTEQGRAHLKRMHAAGGRKPLGRYSHGGYVILSGPRGIPWAYEHRLVAERTLGRPLAEGEEVHHLNGNTSDNRPENLSVVSKGSHTRLHMRGVPKTEAHRRAIAAAHRRHKGERR